MFKYGHWHLKSLHLNTSSILLAIPGGSVDKNLPASAGDTRDKNLIPG